MINWRNLMGVQICLLTWWRGKRVGQDAYGNTYFEDRKAPKTGQPRRWVIYRGMAEASKVPSEWHGWLHHTAECPPSEGNGHSWQKPHQPNLTGTVLAYKPSGFAKSGKSKNFTPYEPWDPNSGPKSA